MKARTLTNLFKIISVVIVGAINIQFYVTNGAILSFSQQKSLLFFALYIYAVFAPIDISIIIDKWIDKGE